MKLFTIAEIAKQLGLPESTVHYYRKRFSEYMPSIGDGRTKRYKPEAFEVMQLIASLVRQGVPTDEVKDALQAKFPIALEQQQTTTIQPQTIQQQQSATILKELLSDAMRDVFSQQTQELRQELDSVRNEIASAKQENISLRETLEVRLEERDRLLMETLRTLQEQRTTNKKSWIRRMFTL